MVWYAWKHNVSYWKPLFHCTPQTQVIIFESLLITKKRQRPSKILFCSVKVFFWEKKNIDCFLYRWNKLSDIIVGSTFYWRQSHAIGGSAVSAHSPRPLTPSYQNIPDSAIKGTALQQNALAPAASHRPSLPIQPHKPIAATPKQPE